MRQMQSLPYIYSSSNMMKKTIIISFLSGLTIFTACKNEAPQSAPVPAPESIAQPDTIAPPAAPVDSMMAPKPSPAPPKKNTGQGAKDDMAEMPESKVDAISKSSAPPALPPSASGSGNNFTELVTLDPSIRLDIRYATANNFTKSKIYDCPRCFLRPEAAKAIVRAQTVLKKKGLSLKMFDCYRPSLYQQRLWDKVPNPNYVTPPNKGSMHSRGAAVDLTLVDAAGKELDMGTPYDFFGREAHTDYTKLPAKVLDNRRILRQAMEAVGFEGIRTEWWHFSYRGKGYPLSDYVWPCE